MSRLSGDAARMVDELCREGNSLLRSGDLDGAWRRFSSALGKVPEPSTDYVETTWIIAAIGDVLFFKKKFQEARDAFEDAVRCPGGLGNIFIHLRLGECHFELENFKGAGDELTRAYMGGGREAFTKEDPKYLEFLGQILKPPAGKNTL